MELVDVLRALDELTFNKELLKKEWYKKAREEHLELFNKIKDTIKEIENEELKERLENLLYEFSNLEGNTLSYHKSYAYEKGAMIGQAFQYLKNDLGFNK